MAARVVGIRQEGESLPDGAVQEGRGTKYASSCHDVMGRCKVRELRVAALVLRKIKKKNGEQKQASLSGEQDPQAGVKDPLSGGKESTS